MRILYLMHEFPIISENFIIYEIEGLLKKGADIQILSLARPSQEKLSRLPEELGFTDKIHYRPFLIEKRLKRLLRLFYFMLRILLQGKVTSFLKLLKDNKTSENYSRYILLETAYSIEKIQKKPDILFCHFGPAGRLGAILKAYGLIDDAKLVTTFHGYDISKYVKDKPKVYDFLFRQGDMFISVSAFFKNKACKLGAPAPKSHVVHTAINLNQFEFQPRIISETEGVNFICVGRMTEKKGHEYTLRAFAKLVESETARRVRLDLIGGGELTDKMNNLIRELGIENYVTNHGPLQHKDVRKKLGGAHIFVLPSVTASDGDTEGIPGALMEAMAQGLPVIATYHTGTPELIDHEVSGLLCQERDVEGLYKAMKKLIDQPDSWLEMVKAARKKVEQDFERQKETDKLYNLLVDLTS